MSIMKTISSNQICIHTHGRRLRIQPRRHRIRADVHGLGVHYDSLSGILLFWVIEEKECVVDDIYEYGCVGCCFLPVVLMGILVGV
ncbi:hypothetical protein BDQ17DRAFT_129796 [Cyathus striatus]|nr:hypothetical protein BDQ17DRAFT_129796 [Cyathus striatus]